jgi:Phospholipid methyltransferase
MWVCTMASSWGIRCARVEHTMPWQSQVLGASMCTRQHAGVEHVLRVASTWLQVPWVDGFPFNVVSHPQYVGSVFSIWGLVVAFWQQQPEGTLLVAGYWTLLYALTAFQESFL